MYTFSVLSLCLGILCLAFSSAKGGHDIIAEVELVETVSTMKAHNSFFFYFRIKEVQQGSFKDSIIRSQEIYSDFGGKQIRTKLENNKRLIIKFNSEMKEEEEAWLVKEKLTGKIPSVPVTLKWASEPDRKASLIRLEEMLIMKKDPDTFIDLLTEMNGKLFYKEKGKLKIAVEHIPGYWITAIVEEDKR